MRTVASIASFVFLTVATIGRAAEKQAPPAETARGDRMLAEYFAIETAKLRDACLADVKTLADWQAKRAGYRRQLREMLGLDPLPERTDLQATITGRVERDEFVVEKLHYQSRPGLYVTANLYRPKKMEKPLPAILYVCGHGQVKKNNISYGNKVSYQHHGAWFARHGFACLTIDSLQLGEIEGLHHGTYRYGMWWWLSRGYTPAGVEAWNCIRALDYLQSRPDIDPKRLGVTGRSGGGAYSWWIAALDDRIQAAVPVAGITDLENHVVDGCVEGHCDCMFLVNTYRWDYPLVAALVAPRPLLLSNTDRDGIFPLEGVLRTHAKVRGVYQLYGATPKFALQITAGGHADTQELHLHAFRWMNEHLRQDKSLIEKAATKFFEPEELKVFAELPADSQNKDIQETFVPLAAKPEVPADHAEWARLAAAWRTALLEKSFRAWPPNADRGPAGGARGPAPRAAPPAEPAPQAFSADRNGLRLQAWDFTSQTAITLRLFVLRGSGVEPPETVVLHVLDDQAWRAWLAAMRPTFEAELKGENLPEANPQGFQTLADKVRSSKTALAFLAPRGVGPTAWNPSDKAQVQVRRRFYLLGQTLESTQVWDVRRAIQELRKFALFRGVPLAIDSSRVLAGVALYASLFEPEIARLDLRDLPSTHRDGPQFLNVLRYLDMPHAVALAAERSHVVLHQAASGGWEFPVVTAQKLGWKPVSIEVNR